ncbi:TrbG/VirB9 family P-type conjugative transfer protein [Leptotrichia sp. OH3620_COT-345]|uniref:TrbG/VirB9 family P-type conjugative transfer protein n=1 Tax=Leptotrichia sp. OH3620_COT-345 TaxID=2491048 RepID=UPI001315315D|nr:TrbG/VirB9 family P-type conjugative transfer protein [Leptotrichia sp. OH3620_COT-345]
MKKFKNILTGILIILGVGFHGNAVAKNNFLSDEAISKMQVKKLISGKQDAIKRVATTFDFYTDSIYDVYVTPDFVTMIKFEPEEDIVAVIGGDNTNFEMEQEFGGADNSIYLFIRPTDLDITSNVNVMTNKRIYMFNLYSTLEIFNPLVKFNYPVAGNTMKTTVITRNDRNMSSVGKNSIMVDLEKIDSNYLISNKNLPFSPTQVFTDGVKTVIIMPENIQEAPVIMVKGVGSKEFEVVNFEYEFNKIIVHRKITEAVLKLGNKQLTIKHR